MLTIFKNEERTLPPNSLHSRGNKNEVMAFMQRKGKTTSFRRTTQEKYPIKSKPNTKGYYMKCEEDLNWVKDAILTYTMT